ncbi:zinc finger protein 577 [Diachasma alloeum]|uniref:zinc finger protein 577 n=1 Tax=Diachasma alloeum TaxID=454923 RepID=UPI0007384230|nr:zinc finger protein 577 [Diachasma alloeum]
MRGGNPGKMSMECPNCGKQTNFSDCRLIQDSCGHEKCRMCLLYEEEGCKTCNDLLRIIPTFPPASQWNQFHGCLPDAEEQQPLDTIPFPPKPPDRNHIVTLPGRPERYKCTICQKTFRNQKGKCYHDVCRTGVSPYRCTLCAKTFAKKSHFEYHERTHTGYKPFSCSICSKAFPQRNKLNRHMLSHDPEKKYLCSFCGKRYSKKDDLTTHSMIHTGAKPHSCPTCGKTFRIRTSLNRHMRSHSSERPWACDVCEKSFKDKALLVRHRKTHGKERPYCCAHCSRVFLSKSELRRHISSHSDAKPFACRLCKTVFRRKDNLIRHIRHHHMGESPEGEGSSPGARRKTEGRRKDVERRQGKVRRGKRGAEGQGMASSDERIQVNSRTEARGVSTPVIRAPGESSNAVPVINGPISIPKPWDQPVANQTVLTYTVPIPSEEAVVINQRIEERLYQQGSEASSVYFYRERASREAFAPGGGFPPLGQNSAVRAVPGGRRVSGDSSFSPPMSGQLTELRSAAAAGLREGGRRKCTIVGDERVQLQLGGEQAEGTNCVSTIKENFGGQTRWRRRNENLREHHN